MGRLAFCVCSIVPCLVTLGPLLAEDATDRTGRVFQRLDKNRDGVLTIDEVPQQEAFRKADTDGNRNVTPAEFAAWAKKRAETMPRETGDPNGKLPEGAAARMALFRLVYIHDRKVAQSSALVDAFGQGRPDILIACKRKVHLVRNKGGSSFTHAATFDVDNANGWGAHDFNGDGRLDAFVAQQHKGLSDSWLTKGDGTFTWKDLGNETRGNTRNVIFADFDGDGHVDSYHSVSSFGTNHSGCELHPGRPDGTFGPDIIETVLDPAVPGFWYATATHPERGDEKWSNKMFKGAFVRDLDRDGKPDLVTGAYADLGFQEGGRGGVGQQWVEQQDRGLFILRNCSEPGKIRFQDVSKPALGKDAYGNTRKDWNVYAVIPIDYDRDGDFDLFAAAVVRGGGRRQAEDTRSVALFENISASGEIRFRDRTKESGFGRFNEMAPEKRAQISFAAGAPFDYDNDGWVDLCLINRRDNDKTPWPWPHLFRNTGKKSFVEVPHDQHGIGDGGGGRDLNYADFDGDGRMDVIIHDGTVGGYDGANNSRIYMNRIENGNHWVHLNVVRGERGVFAFGSRVVVHKAGTAEILGCDEVRTDFCYRSKRSATIHFGLGKIDRIDVMVVTRAGGEMSFKGLETDKTHLLKVR